MTRPVGLFLHGIFCEQVRKEASGSSNFIGVKPRGVRFRQEPPFIFRELTAVVWVISEGGSPPPRLQLRLDIPGQKSRSSKATFILPSTLREDESIPEDYRVTMMVLSFGKISVAVEGILVLYAIFGEFEDPIATLRVRWKPPVEQGTQEPGASTKSIDDAKSIVKRPRAPRKKPAPAS